MTTRAVGWVFLGIFPRLFQSGAKTRLLKRSTTRFSMSSLPALCREIAVEA